MGYIRHGAASALASQRSNTIGAIIPNPMMIAKIHAFLAFHGDMIFISLLLPFGIVLSLTIARNVS